MCVYTVFWFSFAGGMSLLTCMFSPLQYRMVDPAHGALDENYTPEDDSQEAHSVFSEEGTTRRIDNGVKWCHLSHTLISPSSDFIRFVHCAQHYISPDLTVRWRNQSCAQSCPLWQCPSTGDCRLVWASTAPHWTAPIGQFQVTTPPLQFPETITMALWEDMMNTVEGPHQKHTQVWAEARTWMNVTGTGAHFFFCHPLSKTKGQQCFCLCVNLWC